MLKKGLRPSCPGLKPEGGCSGWASGRRCPTACRPIGRARADAAAVIFAFGHGHLGLTQSAGRPGSSPIS